MSTETQEVAIPAQAGDADASAEQALAQDPAEDHDAAEPGARQVPYRITSDGEAAWALRKLRAAQAERQRVADLAQAELDRIAQWGVEQDAGPARDEAYFTGLLGRYLTEQRAKGRKKVTTPQGDLAVRAGALSVQVDDEVQAVAFLAAEAPELVRVVRTSEVDKRALKKVMVTQGALVALADGTAIPGVSARWSDPKVVITPVAGVDPEDIDAYEPVGGAE